MSTIDALATHPADGRADLRAETRQSTLRAVVEESCASVAARTDSLARPETPR